MRKPKVVAGPDAPSSTAAAGGTQSLPKVSLKREYSRTWLETFGNRHQDRRIGSPETKSNGRKAGISGPIPRFPRCLVNCRNAWLGREDSNLGDPEFGAYRLDHLARSSGTWKNKP